LLAAYVGLGLVETLITAIFSLIPDIDTNRSWIGSVVKVQKLLVAHRTVTHSLLALAMACSLSVAFWFPGLAIGYGSHLVADMMTPTGITLLYPKKSKFVIFSGCIATGSKTEKMFRGVIVCLLVALILYRGLGSVMAM